MRSSYAHNISSHSAGGNSSAVSQRRLNSTNNNIGPRTRHVFQTQPAHFLKTVNQQSSVDTNMARLVLSMSAASSITTAEQEHACAQAVFTSFDKDGLGTISADEMLLELEIQASQEEARVLFQYLDTDDDGKIGIEDFLPSRGGSRPSTWTSCDAPSNAPLPHPIAARANPGGSSKWGPKRSKTLSSSKASCKRIWKRMTDRVPCWTGHAFRDGAS